jgi:hypothetical protein
MKASMAPRSWATEVKLAPSRAPRARIENQISTWLSQDAWVGVMWKWTFVCQARQRSRLGLWVLRLSRTDVDLLVGVGGDHLVHEVEELGAAPALAVLGLDLAGRDLERREQGGCAAALVFMSKAGQLRTDLIDPSRQRS